MPTIADFSYVHNINRSNYDLVFKVEKIPSMGAQVYYVEKKGTGNNEEQVKKPKADATDVEYLGTNVGLFKNTPENGNFKAMFSKGYRICY